MARICFLISGRNSNPAAHQRPSTNDNAERLPAAFRAAGWQVTTADHNSLVLSGGTVRAGDEALDAHDLVWPIGLGQRDSFLDRMQLLLALDPARLVTSPAALLAYHAKLDLASGPLARHHPETHAACNVERLVRLVSGGGEWIAKPTAASHGRGVFRVSASDPNLRVILEELTAQGTRYCLLQRYLPEIENGETRVLFANGQAIGHYRRMPGADHRANIAGSGRAVAHELTREEATLATTAARHLLDLGARFVSVDLVLPYVLEYNIANPGGLNTLAVLSGENPATRVVDAFEASG